MHYLVTIRWIRSKLPLIKLVRRINEWGLKDSKDWVEDNFDFDAWLDNMATFEVRLTAAQLGILTYYVSEECNEFDHGYIVSIKCVPETQRDLFDFTHKIF